MGVARGSLKYIEVIGNHWEAFQGTLRDVQYIQYVVAIKRPFGRHCGPKMVIWRLLGAFGVTGDQ